MPWIMKAGKALNERKVEIRVQYKPPAAGIHDQLDTITIDELCQRARAKGIAANAKVTVAA